MRLLYHSQKTFFVISEEEVVDWYKRLRINTLTLVKQGFTREEIFYIPLTEIQDYIRILNNNIEEEQNEIDRMKAESNSSNNVNDLKMAGNTMPGNMF